MGFATGRLDGADNGGKTMVAVYIPTVPNPTSGMLAFFPEEDVVYVVEAGVATKTTTPSSGVPGFS